MLRGERKLLPQPEQPAGVGDGSWAMTADAVERWAESSKPGDRLVYARGVRLIRTPGVEAITQLHDEGEVVLNWRRSAPGIGEWLATRRARPVAPAFAQRLSQPLPPEGERDEEQRVLVVLRRLAAVRRPCPTNRHLAELAKLKDADQAAYQLRKLISAKIIRVETMPKGRVVTIVATGRKTGAIEQ
jgi:hypothetical protein